jgi:hypothetical protein
VDSDTVVCLDKALELTERAGKRDLSDRLRALARAHADAMGD